MSNHPNPNPERSLVEEYGDVVDEFRQLNTDLGLRPYRVFAVVVRHTGGEVGRGTAVVERETELLPTPLVRMRGVRQELKAAGKTDRGYIEISEISPRYTEEQLQQAFHVKPLGGAFEGFYEVMLDRRDGPNAKRRRFVLRDVPERDVESFQWKIRVSAQSSNRGKRGEVTTPRRSWQR